MQNWNSHTLLVAMQNGTTALRKGLVISYETKYTTIL